MKKYKIAVYGLGVMGRSLAKNMISHGIDVALYSKSEEERKGFSYNGKEDLYKICKDEKDMLDSLSDPKIIFLMITAGKPVDIVSENLSQYLANGDILIDGGNAYYKDTVMRCEKYDKKGIRFLGVGVSGGEKGALTGPSMMVGGDKNAWTHVKDILQTIAARSDGHSCCDHVGPSGAGHYVKMVHNGIEYAILQMISDIYLIMKNGICLSHEKMTDIFEQWKTSELDSYLIDISCKILQKKDEDGKPLVEKILDVAGQKGTGKWTLMEAIDLGIYVPSICESVFARTFSQEKETRSKGEKVLSYPHNKMDIQDPKKTLKEALLMGIICCYAQGIQLIRKASQEYNWDIDMSKVISLWEDGCIIRSKLLKDISKALKETNENIIFSKVFNDMGQLEKSIRMIISGAISSGVAIPTLISALSYYDYHHTGYMSVNFVQGLRDCFGAHTYQRIDKKGTFHTKWEE